MNNDQAIMFIPVHSPWVALYIHIYCRNLICVVLLESSDVRDSFCRWRVHSSSQVSPYVTQLEDGATLLDRGAAESLDSDT